MRSKYPEKLFDIYFDQKCTFVIQKDEFNAQHTSFYRVHIFFSWDLLQKKPGSWFGLRSPALT